MLVLIVIVGASVEICLSQPKKLKQIEIPNHEFVKEMIVVSPGKAEGNVAHLYKNIRTKSYWLRYKDSNNEKIRDVVIKKHINPKYNSVNIGNDDEVTFGFIDLDLQE